MSIDTSGHWWRGTEAADIRAYLEAFAQSRSTTGVGDYRQAICPCGSKVFLLDGNPREGLVRRSCLFCRTKHVLLDGEENWDDEDLVTCRCVECDTNVMEAGVGFALGPQGEVHWVYAGVRCISCDVLGCFAHWRIGYTPSRQLLDLA